MSSEENSLWKVKEKVSCLKDNRTPKLAFKQQSGQKREKQKHCRGVNSDTGSLTVNRHSYVGAQTVWLTNHSHRWCQLAQKSVTSHRGGGSRGSRQFAEDGDEDERSREPSMSSSVWFLVALRLQIKYIKTADRHDNMQPNHVKLCCPCRVNTDITNKFMTSIITERQLFKPIRRVSDLRLNQSVICD